jgi:hypothetical protein
MACAALVGAGAWATAALAAPIPVAIYQFATQADVDAFAKHFGSKCKKKLTGMQQMQVAVGPGTNHCAFRSSVVGDEPGPDTDVAATAIVAKNTPASLRKKAFVAVGSRVSESSGWEFRVRPEAKNWQLLRDPAGSGGAQVFRSGKGKFIRPIGKPNSISLQTFDFGSANTQVVATVNGKSVVSLTDSGQDQPDGRRNTVAAGAKGEAAGTGISGIFDDVAIRVPNPYG